MLFRGMIRIVKINVKRILENGHGFLERDTMLFEIARCFVMIPLPRHDVQYNTRHRVNA